MFRLCKVIINLALEHFKKNIKIANARNDISFFFTNCVSYSLRGFRSTLNRIKAGKSKVDKPVLCVPSRSCKEHDERRIM
jgi:hypothetical protein